MGKYLFLVLVLSGFCFPSLAQTNKILSEKSEISIITMGPSYDELYAAFGHSAIRVYDPVNKINYAYNYGTFDFDQPNFYLNFAKGNLLYKLSVQDYKRLSEYYVYYNRFIHEQILDLTSEQKKAVFDYLQNNALPENASYNYDYFYDNCATRIRDVFVATLGNSIRFENNHITSEKSIRELTDVYLDGYYPWGDLGIDLCLGLPMDKIMSPSEYMFIPDYVEYAFDHAFIKDNSGEKPLVLKKNIVFQPEKIVANKTLITPSIVFFTLLVVIGFITRIHKKKGIRGRYLDISLFMLVGFLGVFLSMLWFLTDHKAAAENMNIIWAFPLHLIAAFMLCKRSLSYGWRVYFRVTTILLILLILSWPILPQLIPTSLMFICAIIMLRTAYIGWSQAYARSNSISE